MSFNIQFVLVHFLVLIWDHSFQQICWLITNCFHLDLNTSTSYRCQALNLAQIGEEWGYKPIKEA